MLFEFKALKSQVNFDRVMFAGDEFGFAARIHADLRRRVGGPQVSRASVAQLQARIDLLRKI